MIDTEEAIEAAERDFERIEALLFAGTEDELAHLADWRCPRCGKPFEYEYSPEWDGFSYGCGCIEVRAKGTLYLPSCIRYFGNKHKFLR